MESQGKSRNYMEMKRMARQGMAWQVRARQGLGLGLGLGNYLKFCGRLLLECIK
jgi:hypothetical protein